MTNKKNLGTYHKVSASKSRKKTSNGSKSVKKQRTFVSFEDFLKNAKDVSMDLDSLEPDFEKIRTLPFSYRLHALQQYLYLQMGYMVSLEKNLFYFSDFEGSPSKKTLDKFKRIFKKFDFKITNWEFSFTSTGVENGLCSLIIVVD